MPDIFTALPAKPTAKESPKAAPPDDLLAIIPAARGSIKNLPAPSSPGLFSTFHMRPKGVKFVNQEDDEQIVLFLRRHFITNFPWIFLTAVLFIIPPLTVFLFRVTNLFLFELPRPLYLILLSFYYLVIFSYALMKFIEWFYHVGIVTQQRLLDLDIFNILSHHLAETEIADVVDVSYLQRGFFQSFFNYGDIHIQTEARILNFEFEQAPRPAEVSDIITDLRPRGGGRE